MEAPYAQKGSSMCRFGPVPVIEISGSAKGAARWTSVAQAQVYHDHPYSAPFEDAVIVDLLNQDRDASSRVGLELSADSARALGHALLAAAEELTEHQVSS